MRPHVSIRAQSGWQPVNLSQLWNYRDLWTALAGRDVKLRYRQTFLGVVWVVIQPLLAAGIFAFVFGRVAGLGSDNSSYFLFSFAGLLGWNAFSSAFSKAGTSLVQNAALVSKVFFPRLILPISTLGSTLIDFAVALAAFLVIVLVQGSLPGSGFLFLPVWILLLLMFALGAGLFASALSVQYRDVSHITPVLVQMLLYASPVAYPVSAVPESARFWFLLNPLAPMLEGVRSALLGTAMPAGSSVLYSVVCAVALLVAGAFYFRKVERRFADVI